MTAPPAARCSSRRVLLRRVVGALGHDTAAHVALEQAQQADADGTPPSLGGAFAQASVADALGYAGAVAVVADLTAAWGLWVLVEMPSAKRRPAPLTAAGK